MEKRNIGKKVLKIILLVLLVVIVAFLSHMIRNFVIIKDLQNKISKYSDSQNYHLSIIREEPNGDTQLTDYYKKGSKQVAFLERTTNGDTLKISMYDNGKQVNMYTDANNIKTAKLDTGGLISVQIYNLFEAQNDLITLFYSAVAKISNVNVDGKEYLATSNNFYFELLHSKDEKSEIYLIDKETGLIAGNYNNEIKIVRTYEFDNVDDKVFIEPDINLYTIEK